MIESKTDKSSRSAAPRVVKAHRTPTIEEAIEIYNAVFVYDYVDNGEYRPEFLRSDLDEAVNAVNVDYAMYFLGKSGWIVDKKQVIKIRRLWKEMCR